MKFTRKQIIITGLVFHVLAALFSIGYHHCDELFQVYEFAGYKLGVNQARDLPWEFHSGMRSGVQPLIVYLFTKTFWQFSITDPFLIATIVRLLISLLSFVAVCLFTKQVESEIASETGRKTLWFLSLLLWCMPYFHARFSSENLSATLFVWGLVVSHKKETFTPWFATGLLFGLSFAVRFQLGFMIAGWLGWQIFYVRGSLRNISSGFLGIMTALTIGMLADKWLYGQWTISWWNYLDQNLFQDKASAFGKQPFYFYISESLLQLIPPFSLVFVGAVVWFWWRFRYHMITWITLPFILLHFFVGHKELRFLFPVLYFLPLISTLMLESANVKNHVYRIVTQKTFVIFFLIVNGVALFAFTFKPADAISFSLEKIYSNLPDDPALLLYEQDDPYGNAAALNYFRKKNVITQDLLSDSVVTENAKLFYFSRSFSSPEKVTKHGKVFNKIYASYPTWFTKLNFNDWQSRSFSFSIYNVAGIKGSH